MKFTTCLLAAEPSSQGDFAERADAAVVIDVLRATSVMVTALESGAARVLTCREVDEARTLAESLHPKPLLCGERGCKPIDGFDLGNSPAEYRPERVRGETLVLTTTNGTRAIAAVDAVPRVLIASFLNLTAVVDTIRRCGRVHLVCAGTEGRVTLEDVLLAGAILWKCQAIHAAELLDDDSVLAMQLWKSWFPRETDAGVMPERVSLARRFRETRGGRNLIRVGFEADLERCAAIDASRVVPQRVSQAPPTFALLD